MQTMNVTREFRSVTETWFHAIFTTWTNLENYQSSIISLRQQEKKISLNNVTNKMSQHRKWQSIKINNNHRQIYIRSRLLNVLLKFRTRKRSKFRWKQFLKVLLPFVWYSAIMTKAMIIPYRTTHAADVQVTLQGPHSSHSNSICGNNWEAQVL